jgi:phosphoenolpyruvate-protein kinase (PTS system EI component)
MKWMSWQKVGEGISAFAVKNLRAKGRLREVQTVKDVLRLSKETPKGIIVLLHTAGVTTIAPLFPKVSGIICTAGGTCSHLSILAREFQIPCLLDVKIRYGGSLEEKEVYLKLKGSKGHIFLRRAKDE